MIKLVSFAGYINKYIYVYIYVDRLKSSLALQNASRAMTFTWEKYELLIPPQQSDK